jgi:hypothetical protein
MCDEGVTFLLRTFPSRTFGRDASVMNASEMWGVVLMGAGAVVAGVVGIALRGVERLGAFFTLVIGAGVGLAALAVGTRNTTSSNDDATAFLIASALGFIAVAVSAGILWTLANRSAPAAPFPPSS